MTGTLSVRRIAGALGAEISGINLSDNLDEEVIGELKQALANHLVIFFRDQEMTREQHKAFAARFGKLHRHPVIKGPEGDPDLLILANDGTARARTDSWHSDVSSDEFPPLGSVLYAREIPEAGGDTMWANCYLAYETLSTAMQEFLGGLTATHSAIGLFGKKLSQLVKLDDAEASKLRANLEPVHHPVVRTHPVTGRKSLYVNSGFTQCIDGLSEKESTALLEFLYAHQASPNFTCRFNWREGSVAFWDNRCTLHFALSDYFPEKRHMERYTVVGERPV